MAARLTYELAGYAVLPAATFQPGPTSGQFIDPANGVEVPFTGQQPVQGLSAIIKDDRGGFLVMSDNGFGTQANSADCVLRLFHLTPDFKTATGGSGTVTVSGSFALRDPDQQIPFLLIASLDAYPNGNEEIPVDPAIRAGRLLTGADLDPESLRQMPDGTLWFGDEFGPFLVHADATGKILGAPVRLSGVRAPESPWTEAALPNAASSGGFEGLALSLDASRLYAMLEKHLSGQPERQLNIYEFDPARGAYVADQPWRRYRLEPQAESIGDFTAVSDHTFVVVERDGQQGEQARFKRLVLVDANVVDGSGYLVKRDLCDLLSIPDPARLGGPEPIFTFPFATIEGAVLVDRYTLGVINDNNFPFSSGRRAGHPDDNEFILIRFNQPLDQLGVRD